MYHICYLLTPVDCEEAKCSGTNISASSYQDALKKFQKEHSYQIVYICKQEIIHQC
jgi:hypothetical protein